MFKLHAMLPFALLLVLGLASAQPTTLSPGTFSSVEICTPFSVKVAPGNTYGVSVDAEKSVQEALSATVDQAGRLTLATSKAFNSSQPIKVRAAARRRHRSSTGAAASTHSRYCTFCSCPPAAAPQQHGRCRLGT